MLKHLSPRLCFIGALAFAAPVVAQAPAQEFWDYLADYGDENGNVLDPLEYDQILSLKENEGATPTDIPGAGESATPDLDKRKLGNATMKFKKSSAQASSLKGAAL